MVENESASMADSALERRIGTAAWGLLFIWFGIALFGNVGWGVGLVGVGVLTVAVQLARRWRELKVERSSVIVGVMFIVGGIWNLLDIRVEIVPLLCIIAGIALLISATGRGVGPRERGPGHARAHSGA